MLLQVFHNFTTTTFLFLREEKAKIYLSSSNLQQPAATPTWNGVGDLFDVSADLLVDVVEFGQPAVDASSSVFQTRLDVPDFGMHRPVDVLDLPVFDLPNLRLKLLRHLDGT